MEEKSLPFVSVIVPVYNDYVRIEKCIKALLNQEYPRDKYEVIIVDNGSTDRTIAVTKSHPVTLLVEDKIQSSYAARNMGIRSVQGEVIAFTDSDCIPHSDWIQMGVKCLEKVPNCGLVAGKIKLFFKNPNMPNAVEYYESKMIFNQTINIEKYKYGATANIFTYKSVFDTVGLFNDRIKSGGDNEWGLRVYSHGYKLVYDKNTCVAHPARFSLSQLSKRTARLVGGQFEKHLSHYRLINIFLKKYLGSMWYVITLTVGLLSNRLPNLKIIGCMNKIRFILISVYVELIRNWETMRLLFGSHSKR